MPNLLVLVPALVLAASSPTEKLAEARGLVEAFQYDKAIKTIEAAVAAGEVDHASLVALYELLGVCHATLERPGKAQAAFQLLLTVDPDHQLSKNLPPRTRTPFFEARSAVAKLGSAGLEPDEPTRADGALSQVGVTVKDNPLLPARAVRFTVSVDEGPPQTTVLKLEKGQRHVTLEAKGKHVTWSADLLSERNSVLRHLERDELPPAPPQVPLPPPPPPPVVSPAQPASGPWLRPAGIVMGVLGAGALVTGTVFGVLSNGARSTIDKAKTEDGKVVGLTQAQAQALDATARRDAVIANVCFIAGGLVAASGVLFVIFGAKKDDAPVALLTPFGLAVAGAF